jgi:glutamine synthetase
VAKAACKYETKLVEELSVLIDEMDDATTKLEDTVAKLKTIGDIKKESEFVRDKMIPAMDKLRAAADKAETITAEDYYPFPAYDKLLFGV